MNPASSPFFSTRAASVQELPGLRVTVDAVMHEPRLDAPPDRPHPFVYFLTIHNDSTQTVHILGRKWIVSPLAGGDCTVVEGDGVVGQRPRLGPGESFSYHSYHPVAEDSFAQGAFFGRMEPGGGAVCVRVPAFEMQVPV